MVPIDFQVTCSKVKVKPLCCPLNIFWSLHQINNLVQGLPSMSRWSLWFSGHMFKGQGQTTLLAHCVVRSIFLTPSLNWCRGCPQWVDSPYWFSGHDQRSRSNHSFEPTVLFAQYLLIPCLLASDRFFFYREDTPEFCNTGAYMFLKHFLFWFH